MRHVTLIQVVNQMRYVLIALLCLNHTACNTATSPTKKNTPAVQDESVPVPVRQRGPQTNEPTNEQLAWAQQTLDLLGYHPGIINGQLTPQTRSALTQFQNQSRLPATGTLNDSTVQALQQAEQSFYQPPPQSSRETVRIHPSLPTDNQTTPPETQPTAPVAQNPQATLSLTNIQAVGLYRVAAYLAEAGYFLEPLQQATLETVETALNAFQRDIGVKEWKFLDETTLDKLQSINLSQTRQAELAAAIAFNKNRPINTPTTDPAVTVVSRPAVRYPGPTTVDQPISVTVPSGSPVEPTAPVYQPKPSDPVMPTFTLTPGESVYAIDQIECKSNHEAFVLFYQGQLQQIQNELVQVQVNERYALWYDVNEAGVSDDNWWCIPKKRFCYSHINFTDWRGKLKPHEVGPFPTQATMPARFEIAALVAKFAKKTCSF